MIKIEQWMKLYQKAVEESFGQRVLFIGLQGSYSRGEAGENSDIDVVLILDRVSLDDLDDYQRAIAHLPHRPLICGFVSGQEELKNWNKGELFQFYHDTIPYFGTLGTIIATPTQADAREAVATGACTLYHACSHNYLHEKDTGVLKSLYKAAFFILQAKYYLQEGVYLREHKALKKALSGSDLAILEQAETLAALGRDFALEGPSRIMLNWTSELIRSIGKNQ